MRTWISKSLPLLTASVVLALALPVRAAGSTNDPVSGLPLLPGLHPESHPINLTACRKQGQGNQYIPGPSTVAANIDWYKAHLPGFHFYHATWANRSQDTFWSPDGTKGVSITGTPNSDHTFSVMYLQMKSGLTEHERAAFSPSNPTCK
ncbi:MAG: hypothetical protein ACRD23_02715 [Terriglobales bacterium]